VTVRRELSQGHVLEFPGMQCHVGEVLGMGSNAIVYKGWYYDRLHHQEKHHVLIKELFPFHPQGLIYRDEKNHICLKNDHASGHFQLHRESFEAGNRIHLRLLENAPESLGANFNSYELNGTLYSILGCSGGRSLEEELTLHSAGDDLRRYAVLMLRLLDALEAFHENGYLHLDISPDNILLIGKKNDERMLLIDYNSARRIAEDETLYLSCKPGYSAPELEMGDYEVICAASDLYSVTAVFFRCIMGRALAIEETLNSAALDLNDSACLCNAPQTVQWQVRSILRKGLCNIVEDRYQTIDAMRKDLNELIQRIDCVGVTHWALWETGRRSVETLIRQNPSLQYIKKENEMYPIRMEFKGKRMDLSLFLEELLSDKGASTLTVSKGGMGKTTLLLKTVLMQNRRYAANQTAAFYVSLSGWREGDRAFIREQMLKHLHFNNGTTTFFNALHELEQLLDRKLRSQGKEKPVVLLLLDGLNEAQGDLKPLYDEIRMLSQMQGVRMIVSSRSDAPELALADSSLLSLSSADVEKAAAQKGVLLPRDEAMLELLKTPLILSIFLKASENCQQVNIQSQNELLEAYLESLYEKEVDRLPENAAERWQVDVALHYVLPAIAARTVKTGHALREEEMLKVVRDCYRVISSPYLQKAFPQWIGRSRDVLGQAENAGEWYGVMVHDLLWQQLGLLIRDGQNGYRVFHQTISEWLTEKHQSNRQTILKKKWIRTMAIAAIASFLGTAAWFFLWHPYIQPLINKLQPEQSAVMYPKEETKELLSSAMNRCFTAKAVNENMRQVLGYVRSDPTKFDESAASLLEDYKDSAINRETNAGIYLGIFEGFEDEERYPQEAIMPWSGHDYPINGFRALALMPEELEEKYCTYLEVLIWLRTKDKLFAVYGEEYVADFETLVNADEQWILGTYAWLIEPEMTVMANTDHEMYYELRKYFKASDSMKKPADADADLIALENERTTALKNLDTSAVMQEYNKCHEGGKPQP